MARYAELDNTGTAINVALSDQVTATARGWVGPVPNYVSPGWTTSDGGQTWTSGALALAITDQNRQTLQSRAQAALTANTADITQDQTLITQAATVTATSGTTLTTTQLSNTVRQLAQAVATLAANDTNRAKEVNALIRLALGLLDTTDGT